MHANNRFMRHGLDRQHFMSIRWPFKFDEAVSRLPEAMIDEHEKRHKKFLITLDTKILPNAKDSDQRKFQPSNVNTMLMHLEKERKEKFDWALHN